MWGANRSPGTVGWMRQEPAEAALDPAGEQGRAAWEQTEVAARGARAARWARVVRSGPAVISGLAARRREPAVGRRDPAVDRAAPAAQDPGADRAQAAPGQGAPGRAAAPLSTTWR